MSTGGDGQDWEPVRIMRGGAHGGAGGPPRRHVSDSVVAAAKLDAAAEAAKPKHYTVESVREIQAYRRENGLTQEQMDGRCGFPKGTINKLESRQLTPRPQELQKLNNLLRKRLVLE